ncbi:M14 metallopeptidase family protein [Olivibacter sp. XZL3]|uniref:M14 family metallopeptidase n=1 Tax=Olivibacter sp. XZL3 TaxID=1735116 RepID=UPI0010656033|nr:M14 metallopeptidase family protein [Olivibacter sp. XZL3]
MSWKKIKLGFILYFLVATQLMAQKIPSPKEHFGFAIGEDYKLTNYTETEAYYKKLAALSDRLKLVDIGKTEEGRTQYMLVITSPKNLQQLETFQRIAQKMALAEDLEDTEARNLALQGKAVVWIDGGLHATEVVGTNQLIETAYQLLSRNDPETLHILENVITLLVSANPDGHELVGNWYMKDSDTLKRNTNVPVLYQKYIGHDNNRDFYIANMKESWNMNRQLYLEWLPQIMYNHHQTGPPGSVLAGPPYRDPFNYVFDPLMMTGIDALGAAMYNRLNAENKPGFTRLKGSTFSTWYNGGLRTTTQYHNMIGLLTEIIGNPTPTSIPLVPDRLIPNGNTPNPVLPQSWHFRQSIDYSVSLNYAVLDYAARYKEEVLFNIYRMGKNSILNGRKDHWTLYPKYIDSIKTQYNRDKDAGLLKAQQEDLGYYGNRDNIPMKYYDAIFKNPALRDPRAYIISADQRDFPTAVNFINALLKTGIKVNKATAPFTVGTKRYPAGSYVVKTDQAFRPHVLDMFEPQNYPNDFEYPGGPPIRPYDAAGWTLAFQMGVEFDRIFDAVDVPLQMVPKGELQTASAKAFQTSRNGYLLSSAVNNSFIVVNELLKNNVPVYRINTSSENLPSGSFYIPAKGTEILKKNSPLYGVEVIEATQKPAQIQEIKTGRIALFDQYGGSIPSGWVRWIMEQYHFAFQLIYPQEIDAGNLHKKYDAILFISGGIPNAEGQSERRRLRQPAPEEIPEKYRSMLGSVTIDKSIPQLRDFTEKGGTIVTVGSSTSLAYLFNLPVKNALVSTDKGKELPLPNTSYYIPGSILTTKIDSTKEANWGMTEYADIVFNNSPVFKIDPAKRDEVEVLSWFDTDKPLHSGWAWGQQYLKGGVTSFVASVGKGKLYAFGPEITFRGQAHSTFKLLFNTLYSKQQ